jgi:hypothetical protein
MFAVFLLVLATAGLSYATTVECIGVESGGGGGTLQCGARQYVYKITPTAPITSIEIPTESGVAAAYTNRCAPVGWTMVLVTNTGLAHASAKTGHGSVSPGPVGSCPFKMIWSGPAMAVPFEVGFDHPSPSHDAAWVTSDLFAASWAAAVGLGVGPVHSPIQEIPTLTEWGLITIVVLLLLAGVAIIVRRRRTVQVAA